MYTRLICSASKSEPTFHLTHKIKQGDLGKTTLKNAAGACLLVTQRQQQLDNYFLFELKAKKPKEGCMYIQEEKKSDHQWIMCA